MTLRYMFIVHVEIGITGFMFGIGKFLILFIDHQFRVEKVQLYQWSLDLWYFISEPSLHNFSDFSKDFLTRNCIFHIMQKGRNLRSDTWHTHFHTNNFTTLPSQQHTAWLLSMFTNGLSVFQQFRFRNTGKGLLTSQSYVTQLSIFELFARGN